MSTESLLGGVASLILAAGIILALTSGKRGNYPKGNNTFDERAKNVRQARANRSGTPNT